MGEKRNNNNHPPAFAIGLVGCALVKLANSLFYLFIRKSVVIRLFGLSDGRKWRRANIWLSLGLCNFFSFFFLLPVVEQYTMFLDFIFDIISFFVELLLWFGNELFATNTHICCCFFFLFLFVHLVWFGLVVGVGNGLSCFLLFRPNKTIRATE